MSTFERIVETFAFFEDWEDRYNYLTEIGQKLPALPAKYKTPENLESESPRRCLRDDTENTFPG